MKNKIKVVGAKVHNLKNVSLELPKNKLIVFTGLSGSGKSSLAFDTIYAEGQRRYMESLSAYARQFLDKLDKPDVDHIDGLSPAISIDQKSASHNPRSTVATVTEIYDYFRLLFASIGTPYCPDCNTPIQSQSIQEITDQVLKWPKDSTVMILSPIVRNQKGTQKKLLESIQKDGFNRIRLNGEIHRLTDPIDLDKNVKHSLDIVVDRLPLNAENQSRLTESIETALKHSNGLVTVQNVDKNKETLFSEALSCPDCDYSLPELSHRLFSFNSPIGACPDCRGLGDKLDFDPDLVIEHPEKSIRTCTGKVLNLNNTYYGRALDRWAKRHGFSASYKYNELTETQRNLILYGQETKVEDNPFINSNVDEWSSSTRRRWEGIITNLRRRYYQTPSESMRHFFRSYMTEKPCSTCKGARLKPAALAVKIQNKTISNLTDMTIEALHTFFDTLKLSQKEKTIAKQVLKEINLRISFLHNVGLTYLNLSRKSGTLSGGEFQRIRLATQIGAGLTGVLYVLDEPSIGLHQRDNQKLIQTLKALKDIGNTLIVVEHDEETIREADFIVDIGPQAGANGGEIVFAGTLAQLLKSKTSPTGAFIQGKDSIEIPKTRRKAKKNQALTIVDAYENNLQHVTVTIPLGQLIAVTGVSGSGKSTLINGTLHKALMRHFFKSKDRPGKHKEIKGLEHIDKLITIDQSPIGRTPRSNPATYTQVFGPIRDLFAQTNEAKIRGFKPGRFSFNVKGGRCEACEGDGVVKIDMHFLSDIYVTCEVCKGKRYNEETLAVTFKGHTISDVLSLSISKALALFENIPSIKNKLQTLEDVGLGYVKLGQNATTLSGGEAQRIKLAKELSKRSTGKTLYLLDEPTTGLHFADIKKLLTVLNRLVDTGNTVIVIEHNLDVIKTADHIIDLGPEGGSKGGQIIAEGSPETIAKSKVSHTGKFLKPLLKTSPKI